MVSMKLLMIVLVSPGVAAERQWPFSLWRNDKADAKPAMNLKVQTYVSATDKLLKANKTAAIMELTGKALSKVPTPSFYHTTSGLSAELASMKHAGMSYEKVADPGEKKGDTLWKAGGVELDVVRFKPEDANEEVNNKVMLIAGEHAREMISPETAFGVVQALASGSDLAKQARKNTEWLIVVNANPRSRTLVEAGAHCLRTNPNGVDTNRNWDDNFDSTGGQRAETNPGKTAFSEPETRITKMLMEDFKPNTMLDVHSGTLGLYLPNGLLKQHKYTKKVESRLSEINDKNCNCPLGIANVEVGYQTSGSSLDYAFDKVGTNFAMAMEVWAQPHELDNLRSRWADQKKALNDKPSFLQTVPQSKYGFKQSEDKMQQMINDMSSEDCFAYFNPMEEKMFHHVVSKWSTTLLELAITGKDIPAAKKQSSMLQKPEQASPMGHILRVGAVVLLMVGLWFLWQRLGHLLTKNKAAEATPLAAQQMGPVQVSD